jgi:predicted nucleic acid-binding Zn ribbon protein
MLLVCKTCNVGFESVRRSRVFCSRKCANIFSANERVEERLREKLYMVWLIGGGVQSTAIAVLIESGILPKPDFGVMIDCGYERERTYSYMRNVIIPRMADVGVPVHMVDTLEYSSNRLTNGKGFVLLPAYRLTTDGSVEKLKTRCNLLWKVCVTDKWIRGRGIRNCVSWMGMSVDEARRMRPSKVKWNRNVYPLIDLGMSREDCLREIERAGWSAPMRTSCTFCPQQTDEQWRELEGGDWAMAVDAENRIREEAPNVFLHRGCKPLEETFSSPPVIQG